MRSYVTYTSCAIFSMEQTGNIITFAQFEEGCILTKTREDAEIDDESGEKAYEDSIFPPLLSVEETNALESVNESDYDLIST